MRRSFGIVLAALTFAAIAPAAANAESTTTGPVESQAANTPVVFVHGYSGSSSNWSTARTVFRLAGYSSDELHSYEYDWRASNEESAAGLADFVENVKSETGSDQVNIVNHSMGGLVSGWYIKELDGQPNVANLASLAGANHGTTYASACTINASCREMLPSSDFVEQLTSGDETPGNTGYATWYSSCDGVIIPYDSTVLEGADNNRVLCETHIGFLANTDVLGEVVDSFA
ncbi:esterase/lipase family protein [Parasphingorhabdus pacifica]